MAKARQGQNEPTVIKKYANRRLYDTGRSSYVTLNDLVDMVKEGYDFVVYDAKTGEDITRSVLAQIMAEKESTEEGGKNLLPTSFMRNLVALYGGDMNGFVQKYLETTLDAFMKNQERMREQFSKSFEGMSGQMGKMPQMPNMNKMFQMPGMPGMEEMKRQNMAMVERTMKMFTPFGMPGMAAPGNNAENPKEKRARELRDSIAAMQKELDKISGQ